MNKPILAPKTLVPEPQSFINLPVCTNWRDLSADAVIFGVPFGKPYLQNNFPNDQSLAPFALRSASDRIIVEHASINMDYEDTRSLANGINFVDGGDIPLVDNDVSAHYLQGEEAVRYAVTKGIIPVTIGGDDGITNPVLRGLDVAGSIALIQIDAHLDWKSERYGEKDGYSSPMRRASELSHVSSIHQIGIRSFGSSTEEEVKVARKWGADIHTARQVHAQGIERVIKALPKDVKFFITLDVDGLDPSVMPGTVALAPGGLLWWQLIDLLDGISEKGPIIGLNVVELSPKNDLNQISMIGVGRFIVALVMREALKK
ncbi:arginase family protein [Alphaproteobacteria bacterium]|nr:arginase family protein [Alphaproteobacteria bacterium]